MCLEAKATAATEKPRRSAVPIDLTKTYRFRDGVVAKHLRRSELLGSAYPFVAEHQTWGTILVDEFGNYYADSALTGDWDLIPEPPAPVTFDFAKTYRYRNGVQPIDVFLRSRNPAMTYTNRNDLGDDSVFPVVSICPEGRSRSHTSEGRLHIGNRGTFSEWDLLEEVVEPAKPDWLRDPQAELRDPPPTTMSDQPIIVTVPPAAAEGLSVLIPPGCTTSVQIVQPGQTVAADAEDRRRFVEVEEWVPQLEPEWTHYRKGSTWLRCKNGQMYAWAPGGRGWSFAGLHSTPESHSGYEGATPYPEPQIPYPEPQIPHPEPGTQVAYTLKSDSLPRPVRLGEVRALDGKLDDWYIRPQLGYNAGHQKDIHEYWTLVPGSGIKKP